MDGSDSEESDIVLVGPEDVENFNPANIVPLPVAELEEIRAWLQPTPYAFERSEYSRHLASHLAGTGKWLTSTAAFQRWREGDDNGLLWIKGIPGSGKSVMAASIINQLKREEFPVIYFFFRQIIDANHQPIAALRDWLCQILSYSPPLQARLKGYIQSERSLESLSVNDFWKDLKSALALLPRVYCITDALDEMDSGQGNTEFLLSLAELGKWKPSSVKVLMTSRPVAIIEKKLRSTPIPEIRLEEKLVDTDIIAYVQSRLQHSSVPRHRWETIKKAIPGRANGLFLYAKLSMDTFVESSAEPDAVLEALPADLNVMYNNLLHEHAKRSNVPDDLQILVLQFVTHATRPIRLLEMAEVVKSLRVLDGDSGLREIKDLVRTTCGPLLEILPDETISVVHHSLTEFLKGHTRSTVDDRIIYPIFHPGPTNQRLAVACLDYLESGCIDEKGINQQGLKHSLDSPDFPLSKMRLQYPFLEYAATNWYTHASRAARAGSDMSTVNKRLDEFFAKAPSFYALSNYNSQKFNWGLDDPNLLHIAACAGLDHYVRHLLQKGELDIESRDAYHNNALYWAAKSGSAEVVQALLDHGADPNAQHNQGLNALHVAASENHAGVVKILLTAGVDPLTPKTKERPGRRCGNAPRTTGHTPLMYACNNGHVEAIAEFLPFLKDANDFQRALFWVAAKGHSKAVKLILQQTAVDVNGKYRGDTALFKACQSEDRETISELLLAGADPNITCENSPAEFSRRRHHRRRPSDDEHFADQGKPPKGETALHAFCESASKSASDTAECIKLLIDFGAEVNFKNPEGLTALHIACRRNGKLVKPLLEAGADPTVEDDSGLTVLHTDGKTDEEILPVLLGGGVLDINKAGSCDGKTPLHCRVLNQRYDERSILPFLQYRPDVNAVDFEGNTVLHYAVNSKHSRQEDAEFLDTLLNAGADPNIKNRQGDTPLHKIDTFEGHWQISKLVLAGADIEARNHKGQTPLFSFVDIFGAGLSENTTHVSELQHAINLGARLDTRDFQGRTLLYQCREKFELFDHLVGLGLDPMTTDYQNNSLLFDALESSKAFEIFKRLGSMGLQVDRPNNAGRTVLHKICSKVEVTGDFSRLGSGECPFEYLLRACNNLNHQDVDGIQPLHIAASISPGYVFKLIEAGADLFGLTYEDISILHIAARARQSDIVSLIISKLQGLKDSERKKFINLRDKSGRSALHYACRSGRPETVKLLLEAGASPNVIDKDRKSPFRAAAEFESEDKLWSEDRQDGVGCLNAAGIILEDKRRPFYDKDFMLEIRQSFLKIEVDNDTCRLEEILELLFTFGARVTGKNGCLQKAFDDAVTSGLDYTVECLVRFKERFAKDHEFENLHDNDDYRICESRSEATRTGLRSGRMFNSPEDDFKLQRGRLCLTGNFSEKLLFMRQYDLLKERLSGKTVSGIFVPATLNPTHINKQEKSPLHILVEWGYTNLLSKVCTTDMALKFDNYDWHAPAESDAACSPGRPIKPLLMAACSRILPNMDMVRYLVENLGVNVDAKEFSGFSSIPRGVKRLCPAVLHNLARGKSWWHVDQALPYLIQQGADIELRDGEGRTPLHIALNDRFNHGPFKDQAARVLINFGANVNASDNEGNTCLSNPENGVEMIKLLLSHGVQVNRMAVLSAINQRKADILDLLLSQRCHSRVTQPGDQENHIAGKSLLQEIDPEMSLLLAIMKLHNRHLETDESLAADQTRMIRILLKHGASPYATFPSDLRRRFPSRLDENLKDGNLEQIGEQNYQDACENFTIVHYALETGMIVVPFFQTPFLDLEHIDESGCTLILAASKNQQTMQTKLRSSQDQALPCKTILEELLDRGANALASDNDGKTILHHIIYSTEWQEFLEMARSIVVQNPELVHIQDHLGDTPIHYALRLHSLPYIKLLLEHGACMLDPDYSGNTALHHLAYRMREDEWKDMFQKFLDAGVDINSKNKDGETPLFRYIIDEVFDRHFSEYDQFSTSEFTEPCFDFFKENGADFFVRSKGETSLLHLLASFEPHSFWDDDNLEKIVRRFKFFMDFGLDPMLEDSRQRTSLDIAAAYGREEILKLFERKPLG